MIKDITYPTGVKIYVKNSYKDLLKGSRKIKKVSREVDDWVSSHNVIIFNKIEKFYDITVVFNDKTDYTLFALTWNGNEYEFVFNY